MIKFLSPLVIFLAFLTPSCQFIDCQIKEPGKPTARPTGETPVTPTATPTVEPTVSPTETPEPSPTVTPTPTPQASYKPPTMFRVGNGIYGPTPLVALIPFPDGVKRLAFKVDSTPHYVTPFPTGPGNDVCEEGRPHWLTVCQGRDWGWPAPTKWEANVKILPVNGTYQAWVERAIGVDIFVTSCPPTTPTYKTEDGFDVPVKGTECFTRLYRF